MKNDTYKDFGFKKPESKIYQFFLVIPGPPQIITIKDLAKKANISKSKVRDLISKLPTEAPVFQDDEGKYIGRTK